MKGKRVENKKKALGQALFTIAFILILYVDYVSATSIPVIYSGRLFQAAILLLLIKVIITHYSKKEWIALISLLGLGIISYLYVKNFFFIILILLLFGSKEVSFKNIIRIYLVFVSGLTLIVGIAASFGWFGEMSLTMDFRSTGIETRYCMGYTHPNTYHIVLLQLCLALFWLLWEKTKWYHVLLAIVGNCLIFAATDSRTNLLVGIVLFLCMFIAKLKSRFQNKNWVYGLGFLVLGASLLLSLLTVLIGTDSKLIGFIDKMWTNRIRYGYLAVKNNGILSLFSSVDSQVSTDMGYIRMFYNYGFIIFAAVILLFILKLYINAKNKDFMELIILVAGIVFMLGENFSFGEFITRNIIFLFLIGMLSRDNFISAPQDKII